MSEAQRQSTVLVTDSGRASAIAVIRSLGRAGYKIIAADESANSLGFRSRYVGGDNKAVYPSPAVDARSFTQALLDTVRTRKVDLLIPVTDDVIYPIARARDAFQKFCKIALPGNSRIAIASDKLNTLGIAKELGIPIPRSYAVNEASEALDAAEDLGWPVVIKPRTSKYLGEDSRVISYKVSYAASKEELVRAVESYKGKCTLLLQEYWPGIGYGLELLMQEGTPLAAFAHRRLREYPISGGPSSYRESVSVDNVLYEHSIRLLEALNWTGVAMVEFKVRGLAAALMEVNGRIWGSLPLAVRSGVDFPLLLARLFLEGRDSIPPQSLGGYRIGLRCRDLQRDLQWIACVLTRRRVYSFLELPSRMRALKALGGMLNPKRKFDLLCLDDPVPGLLELPRIAQKIHQKARQAH